MYLLCRGIASIALKALLSASMITRRGDALIYPREGEKGKEPAPTTTTVPDPTMMMISVEDRVAVIVVMDTTTRGRESYIASGKSRGGVMMVGLLR